MFRRLVPLLVLASLAILAVAVGATAQSGSRTLTFLDVSERFVPLEGISPNAPPSIGARYIFIDALYNRGAQFGKPSGARPFW